MSHSSSTAKHPSQTRRNLGVFLALAAMTAIELALSAMGVIGLGSIAFLVLSLAKAALVALFFMHLRDDSKWYGMVFLAPVLLVLVMSLLVVAA